MSKRTLSFLLILQMGWTAASAVSITNACEWRGDITVSETVTVSAAGSLTILPAAKVSFKGAGKLVCHGPFKADGAVFAADSDMAGDSRIEMDCRRAEFRGCLFRNMVTVNKRFHDAFMSFWNGQFIMTDCEFFRCSAVEVVRSADPLLESNCFRDPVTVALVLFHCDRGTIVRNVFRGGNKTAVMLKLNNADNGSVVLNHFFGPGVGINLYGDTRGYHIMRNFMFAVSGGIDLWGAPENNLMLGNLVFRPLHYGIRIMNCKYRNIIRNCVVWGAGGGTGIEQIEGGEVAVGNSVIAGCGYGVAVSSKACGLILENDFFWNNRNDFRDDSGRIVKKNLRFEDPLFVAPEEGNFRPKLKSFGYENNSPLLNAGAPAGTSVGLYPVLQ